MVRLSVHRTPRHIYAQMTDADGGESDRRRLHPAEGGARGLKGTGNVEAAKAVGKAIAERAQGGRRDAGWPSTVPASSSTAASRRWPKRRAKPDSSSKA